MLLVLYSKFTRLTLLCFTRPIWPSLQALKEYWGVSIQALLYRARELGVYSDVTYRNAMLRMSHAGWRRQEPGVRPTVEQPSLFPGALKLLEDSGVTATQLAAEARIPMNIFRLITARNIEAVEGEKPAHVHKLRPDQEVPGVVSLLVDSLS